jgi:hypothetical protein
VLEDSGEKVQAAAEAAIPAAEATNIESDRKILEDERC